MTLETPRVEFVAIDLQSAMLTDPSKDCTDSDSQSGSHCTGAPYADQSCFDSAPLICDDGGDSVAVPKAKASHSSKSAASAPSNDWFSFDH